MEELQSPLYIKPEAIKSLEDVLSRLRVLSSRDNVFFDAADIDSWKLDDGTCPARSLACLRGVLQDLDKIKEAASRISAAAEAFVPTVKSNLMHVGLHSLPTEILQDILYISVVKDENQRCDIDLNRVLAIQTVSRYFRDIVQGAPEFWIFASSKKVPLLELQLERTKGLGLHLRIFASDLFEAGFCDVFSLHASRWRSLQIHLPKPENELRGPIHGMISPLTFVNLRNLEIHHERIPAAPINFTTILAPKLTKLSLFHCIPSYKIGASLSVFSFSYDVSAYWPGVPLLSFIASQKCLKVLELHLHGKPEGTAGEFIKAIDRPSLAGDRDMHVILRFCCWSSTIACSSIWMELCAVGIDTLTLDLSNVPDSLQHQVMCRALHYSYDAPSLKTLVVTLAIKSSTSRKKEPEYGDDDFPLSLRSLAIHNCWKDAIYSFCPALIRLLCRQEASGAAPFEDLVFSGQRPSKDDYSEIQEVLGDHRISFV